MKGMHAMISFIMAGALVICSASFTSVRINAESSSKVVTIDGNKANTASQSRYRGFGMVSGNNSSRLLLDYKDEHPDQYWEIMNYLFNTETGMGISHIKVEMGSDVNSSSGTEPCVKRTEKETADVTRGASYQLAADAKTINPNITLDMLWWSEPLWVTKSKNIYAARYQWYKETLDAAYKTYGLKFDYVSANRNEKSISEKWIIYLSKALKAEKNCPYDYSKIKIVASDENATWDTADMMLKNKSLLKAVDVIGTHYTSKSTNNAKKLNKKYGKELWFSEGSAPMSYSQGTYKYDGNGSGISGINGMLDIATRIITMYPKGLMNLYEFQPAVAAYYGGSTYFPKQLITANEPWSGHYTLDAGFYMAMHFAHFAKTGWQYIDGACNGDGVVGGDGHAIVDSTYNYQTMRDPKTGDYSIVIANNTAKTLHYTFQVTHLAKSSAPVDVWETRGPDNDKGYYQNYLKKINTVNPQSQSDGSSSYQISIKPYSLVTVTTLNKEASEYKTTAQATILNLPYSDDFEYNSYDSNYLSDRGDAPRFTTDEGGAFEVVNLKGNHVIQQKVTYHTKAEDWGYTPDPVTNLGDDNWTNYSVSADVLFSSKTTKKSITNYVGVGARYIQGSMGQSGYWLQLSKNGKYQLNKVSDAVTKPKTLKGFNSSLWYNLKVSVNKNVVTCYINNKEVISYRDKQAVIASGRAALYSDYNANYFDNLKVETIDGITPYSARLDDTDSPITYSGKWQHNTMSSFSDFNRTESTGSKGASFRFNYTGEGFSIIGAVDEGSKISVTIDGKMVESGYKTPSAATRNVSYANYNLVNGKYTVVIKVLSGSYCVDAVEIVRNDVSKLVSAE